MRKTARAKRKDDISGRGAMEEVSEIVVPLSVVDGEEEVLLVIVMLR